MLHYMFSQLLPFTGVQVPRCIILHWVACFFCLRDGFWSLIRGHGLDFTEMSYSGTIPMVIIIISRGQNLFHLSLPLAFPSSLPPHPPPPPYLTLFVQIGAQEHFYLETNATLAVPGENGSLEIFASTQNPTKTQALCASVCGVDQNKVRSLGGFWRWRGGLEGVDVKRGEDGG